MLNYPSCDADPYASLKFYARPSQLGELNNIPIITSRTPETTKEKGFLWHHGRVRPVVTNARLISAQERGQRHRPLNETYTWETKTDLPTLPSSNCSVIVFCMSAFVALSQIFAAFSFVSFSVRCRLLSLTL